MWSDTGTLVGCQNVPRNVDTFEQYTLPKKDRNDQEFVSKCIKYLSFNTITCQLQPDHDFLIKSTLCKSFKKNVLALTYF